MSKTTWGRSFAPAPTEKRKADRKAKKEDAVKPSKQDAPKPRRGRKSK